MRTTYVVPAWEGLTPLPELECAFASPESIRQYLLSGYSLGHSPGHSNARSSQ